MNAKYKFAKGKHICPQCSHKTFVKYNNLPEHFGYCERKNNCGYEYFATKENLRQNILPEFEIAKKEQKPVSFILPNADFFADILKDCSSNFHKYCLSLGITESHLSKWNIGTDKKGDTVFIFKNIKGQICNRKVGRYNTLGKRDKAFGFYSLPAKSDTKYFLPLFGEHQLMQADKDSIIALVESEKTAVIASFFYPEFLWLAAGSANGLSDGSNDSTNKISAIKNYYTLWMADADMAGRQNSSIRNLTKHNVMHSIIDLFPERLDGWDIADELGTKSKPIFFSQKINFESGEIKTNILSQFIYTHQKDTELDNSSPEKNELRDMLPKGVDVNEALSYGFYEYQNRYHFLVKQDEIQCLSNFTIKVLFLINSKTNPKRIVELKNEFNYSTLIDLPTSNLVSLGKFKECIEAEGNFLFDGKDTHLQKLKRKLYREEKRSKEIETLGWQVEDGFYAFSNGIFNGQYVETDSYGIVEHKDKNYFIPALSKIYKFDDGSFENEKKFVFKKSELNFTEWAFLFCDVYGEKNNGRIGLLYFIAALFRDVIYRRLRFFPHLNLFGVPGSGKSTMAQSLMYLFGEKQEPFMLGNAGTTKGFMRKFGQFRNALVWLDEYKNSIDKQKIEALKNIYDGVGYERAVMSQDNRTKTTPVHSACILSGQELPTSDPALFKRVILLQFEKVEFSEPNAIQKFDFLKENENKGLSSIVCEVMKHRTWVEDNFNTVFDACFDEFRKSLTGYEIEDRIMKNYCLLFAINRIMSRYLNFPFSEDELFEQMLEMMKSQTSIITNSNDVQKFWDIVEYLFERGEILSDVDFKIVNKELYLQISKVYPLYMEAHQRQYNARGMDKSSLLRYFQSSKGYIKNVDSTRFKDKNTSAILFDLNKLKVNLKKENSMDYEMLKQEEEAAAKSDDIVPF